MEKKICIAIDAMGGENSPFKNIKGINLFYNKNKNKNDFLFNIFGDKEKISNELKNTLYHQKFITFFIPQPSWRMMRHH